jgi:hypothetical protein
VTVEREALVGHWVHAHEEDGPTTLIFRPASWDFPPSRGRTGFELRPDGTYAGSEPGPADAPASSEGSWELEGDRLVLRDQGGEHTRTFELEDAEPDRLVVRRR